MPGQKSGKDTEGDRSTQGQSAVTTSAAIDPKTVQDRIRKRHPNPAAKLTTKYYALQRFDPHRCMKGRMKDAHSLWHTNDMAANKNGKRQLIVLDDGTEYVGDWKQNLRHGEGSHYTVDGCYEGEFVDDLYEGEGSLYAWCDTSNCERQGYWLLYSGAWKEGTYEGRGVEHDQRGRTYEGDFVCGKRNGDGTMYYENGDTYTGNWVNGVRSGHGEIQHANGDLFEGEFADDKRHGPGTLHIAKTKRKLVGVWFEGMFKAGSYYDECAAVPVCDEDITGLKDGLIPICGVKGADEIIAAEQEKWFPATV